MGPVRRARHGGRQGSDVPRCCRNCIYANPLQHGDETFQICVNTPGAQGSLRSWTPAAYVPDFASRRGRSSAASRRNAQDKGARYIPLTQGLFAIVDAADFEQLNQYRWYTTTTSPTLHYVGRKEQGGASIRMHREIMRPPKGMVVHHVNGNGLDNRRANLCVCTHAENMPYALVLGTAV